MRHALSSSSERTFASSTWQRSCDSKKIAEPLKPPAVPAAVVASVGTAEGCQAYRSLVGKYDWDVTTAMAVMQAENTACNPVKDNKGMNSDGSVDYGLFQVNSIHADMVGGNLELLRDPSVNIAVAYRIYSAKHNWTPWSTFNSGKYKEYVR